MAARRKLRVLFSVAPVSDRDNPYITLLERSLLPEVEPVFYTKWRALFSSYDVMHVHWPDHLLRGGGKAKVVARQLTFAAILIRATILRVPIVRTLHNVNPHEQSSSKIEAALLRWLDALTRHWIILNQSDALNCPGPSTLVPHGHYKEWYPDPIERLHDSPPVILNFGLIRKYKQIPELINAFHEISVPDIRLRISGAVDDAELKNEIIGAAAGDPRIELTFRHLDDQELVDSVSSASLVVLPYANLGNSGALLLSLSYGTPVLVPNTRAGQEYANEFGPEWVRTYEGSLDGGVLADAATWASNARPDSPNLANRSWRNTAVLTRRIYETVISTRRKRKLWLSE